MDDAENTSLLNAGPLPPKCLDGHPQGLQLLPAPDTNGELGTRVCAGCHKLKSVSDFYRKRDRFDSKCKSCILSAKSRAYRAKRVIVKRLQKELTWNEVFETVFEETDASRGHPVKIEELLRDFMLEVILDAS